MKSLASIVCVALGAIVTTAFGCSSEPPPEFKPGSGQEKAPEAAYPEGPYGIGEGSIIANYQFIGYANAKLNNQTMQALQLADFYNPHGRDATYQPASGAADDRLFPEGSAYPAGTPKPTVLLIDIASVWCGPCNAEAGGVLPLQHKKYAPCGGEFFLQLADGPTQGTSALPKHLNNWTTKYKVDYPSSIDPTYKLQALFEASAYPTNLILDTTTMKIVKVIAGEVIAKACNDGPIECSSDTTCTTCTAYNTGSGTANFCGDGNPCTTNADCTGLTCSTTEFWRTYEQLLDKGRNGCTVK